MILQHLTSINRLAVRLTLSERRKRQFVVAQRSRACDQRPLWKLDIFRLCSLAILTFCLMDLMRGSSARTRILHKHLGLSTTHFHKFHFNRFVEAHFHSAQLWCRISRSINQNARIMQISFRYQSRISSAIYNVRNLRLSKIIPRHDASSQLKASKCQNSDEAEMHYRARSAGMSHILVSTPESLPGPGQLSNAGMQKTAEYLANYKPSRRNIAILRGQKNCESSLRSIVDGRRL